MLHEFALMPDLFAQPCLTRHQPESECVNEVKLVQLLRGILDFGIIANLNDGAWIAHVLTSRLAGVAPQTRDKIQTLLKVLQDRRRLVRFPKADREEPNTDLDWLKLAEASHCRFPFRGIFLSDSLHTASGQTAAEYQPLSCALDSECWMQCTGDRQDTLEMTEADYRPRLTPLLRHALKVTLVDPYFNVSRKKFEVMLRLIAELLGDRLPHRTPRDIHIHAEVRKQTADQNHDAELRRVLQNWTAVMRSVNNNFGHGIRLFLWDQLESRENPHDRYLLTDQVGISTPGGLDCFRQDRTRHTVWTRLAEKDRRIWLEHVDPASSPYRLATLDQALHGVSSNPIVISRRG